MPRSRYRALGPAFLALLIVMLVGPQASSAALVTLQYRPTAAASPAPADLTPIAPFDGAWNPPTNASSGVCAAT